VIDTDDLPATWDSGTGANAISGHPAAVEMSIPSAQLAGLIIADEAAMRITHTFAGEIVDNFGWLVDVSTAQLVINYRTENDPAISLTSSTGDAVSGTSSTGDSETATSSAADAVTDTSTAGNTVALTSSAASTVTLTSSIPDRGDL